jgi:ABC-type enterochelin transport system substrate-binding protein
MRLFLALALALLFVACSDDSKPPTVDAKVVQEAAVAQEVGVKEASTPVEASTPKEASAASDALPTQ